LWTTRTTRRRVTFAVGQRKVDSGLCRDAPYHRCGQDEQHRIDHDPVRNHVASSFDL
jgi:hypothetical protein